jgi:hypothetical protein
MKTTFLAEGWLWPGHGALELSFLAPEGFRFAVGTMAQVSARVLSGEGLCRLGWTAAELEVEASDRKPIRIPVAVATPPSVAGRVVVEVVFGAEVFAANDASKRTMALA